MVREHKNRPTEVSSKHPVSVFREVVPNARKKAIDPRFDRSFGSFNDDLFKKSYTFIGDIQQEEKKLLKNTLTKEQDPRKRMAVKQTLDRLLSMSQSERNKEKRQKIVREHRKMERELVEKGKNPYFLKKSDRKRLEMADEFEQIKKKYGENVDIDRLIEKKRKRKASKQKKFLPRSFEESSNDLGKD